MATELQKLNHRRDQLVLGHEERRQKRATDLATVKAQAASTVQEATDRAERDQKNEDATHASRLADLDKQIAETTNS
jgi:hypothetical protein